MTEAEALARLTMMVSPDEDPVLSADEVQILLDDARVADRYGLLPSDASWEGTWRLNQAAARGWRVKAGKAASRVDMSNPPYSLSRDQLIKHCQEMAKEFSKGDNGTIYTGHERSPYDPVIGNLNGG